jgi:hypothetical protein
MGVVSEAVAKVMVEVEGRPPVEVPTFTSFDAAGQQIARGTDVAGYPDGCR